MHLFKALAISSVALFSPLGGHVGPGLAAAESAVAVAEDWKGDKLVSLIWCDKGGRVVLS